MLAQLQECIAKIVVRLRPAAGCVIARVGTAAPPRAHGRGPRIASAASTSASGSSGSIVSARRKLSSAAAHCPWSCKAAPRLRSASASFASARRSPQCRQRIFPLPLECHAENLPENPAFGCAMSEERAVISASLSRPSLTSATSAPDLVRTQYLRWGDTGRPVRRGSA